MSKASSNAPITYVSTRGQAPELGLGEVVLSGLARDSGLYVPKSWPQLDAATIRSLATKDYAQTAKTVLAPYGAGAFEPGRFEAMIEKAYSSFRHPATTPLVQIGPAHWVLELFHGPTLAFKDVAMQLLGPMMDEVLGKRGERATIVGATSGDTGSAAIEAFRGRDNTDIFILFPHGKVSPVQQRQMTTVGDDNVHAIAIEGNFDDCQSLVKAMFNHHAFRDQVSLAAVNSINWARIMAQIVYYFAAAARLGAPERKVSFTVPTGNFGDIFAGLVAKRMGLPVADLVIATNANDILARTLKSGRYETAGVVATTSPSMDIQVSSNFERALFEAAGRDAGAVAAMMSGLSQSGSFAIDDDTLAAIRADFKADRADEAQAAAAIRTVLEETGVLLDPHTATGVGVAERFIDADTAMITLATAHPAKFPDAVESACGTRPGLPAWLDGLMERRERFTVLANDQGSVEAHIASHSRAARTPA